MPRQDPSPITQELVADDLAAVQNEIIATRAKLSKLQRTERILATKVNSFTEATVSNARKKGKKANIDDINERYGIA